MKKNVNSIKRLSNLKCVGHAGKRITLICTIYSVICGTLYCVSIPTVFNFVFGVESSNLITNCLKFISLIGIILSSSSRKRECVSRKPLLWRQRILILHIRRLRLIRRGIIRGLADSFRRRTSRRSERYKSTGRR